MMLAITGGDDAITDDSFFFRRGKVDPKENASQFQLSEKEHHQLDHCAPLLTRAIVAAIDALEGRMPLLSDSHTPSDIFGRFLQCGHCGHVTRFEHADSTTQQFR